MGQGKHAEAEPLLLAGYLGLLEREETIPMAYRVRVTEALEWRVQLYDAWGKKNLAEEWRAPLETRATTQSERGNSQSETTPN